MATAKKTKEGNWRVLAYVGKGVTKSGYKSFTAATKRDAEAMASKFLLDNKHSTAEDLTVREAVRRYIDSKSNVLSPATIRGYETIYRNSFSGIMSVKLKNLTVENIQSEINREATTKGRKTIQNACALLHSSLAAQDISLPGKLTLPQKEKKEIVIPTAEEIDQLMQTADEDMKIVILLASAAGLRRSEICALQWSDFDSETETLRIDRAIVPDKNGVFITKAPKSTAGKRAIHIPPSLLLALNNYKIRPSVTDRPAKDEDSIIPLTPNMLTSRFSHIVHGANIDRRVTLHSLRHYYASVMLALNIPDKYAMENMGHATNIMLKNVYQHLMDDARKRFNDSIDDYYK